jgi:hypothetical protein
MVLSSSLCLVEEKDENNFFERILFFCRHQRDRWSFLGLKTLVARPLIIHLEIL